jgi:hypothetical protein
MKKILAVLIASFVAVSAYSQGTFSFSNFSGPVDAPVSKAPSFGGGLVDSANYVASVAWAQGVVSDPNALTLIPSATTPFFGSSFPGYFFGPNVSPGSSVNGVITVQVRYNNSVTGEFGNSGLFQVTLGTSSTALPADLVGLTAVQLQVIPEPSTIALAGLGAAALLIFRRRK